MKNNNVVEFKTKTNKANKINKANADDGITINETNSYEDCIQYPTKIEIQIMNAMLKKYTENDPDIMVPFNMWNGDCMKTIFSEMSEYAKEIGEDPWDAFALFLHKLDGWRMETTEDGGVAVHYGKE